MIFQTQIKPRLLVRCVASDSAVSLLGIHGPVGSGLSRMDDNSENTAVVEPKREFAWQMNHPVYGWLGADVPEEWHKDEAVPVNRAAHCQYETRVVSRIVTTDEKDKPCRKQRSLRR